MMPDEKSGRNFWDFMVEYKWVVVILFGVALLVMGLTNLNELTADAIQIIHAWRGNG